MRETPKYSVARHTALTVKLPAPRGKRAVGSSEAAQIVPAVHDGPAPARIGHADRPDTVERGITVPSRSTRRVLLRRRY